MAAIGREAERQQESTAAGEKRKALFLQRMSPTKLINWRNFRWQHRWKHGPDRAFKAAWIEADISGRKKSLYKAQAALLIKTLHQM